MDLPTNLDERIAALSPEVDENIRNELQEVWRTLRHAKAPNPVISRAYSLGLIIVKTLFSLAGQSPSKADNLNDCAREARAARLLPEEMQRFLDIPRTLSNKVDHDVLSIKNRLHIAEVLLSHFLIVLEWLYCESPHGPKLPTIYLDLPSASLLPAPSPSTTSSSLLPWAPQEGTTLFSQHAQHLADALNRNISLVVVVGSSGAGKSRVASSLFEPGCLSGRVPLWFSHNSSDELLRSLGTAQQQHAGHKLCVILDEDHQPPSRDAAFFHDLLSSPRQTLLRQAQVVLALRNATYYALDAQGLLAQAETIELRGQDAPLSQHQLWGCDRPFTQDEQAWIQQVASDEHGHLIPFLVDRLCVPYVRSGQPLSRDFGSHQSVLETVYQGLIAGRPEDERRILEALRWASQAGAFVPVWLLAAVLRAQGHGADIDLIGEALDRLEQDGLVTARLAALSLPVYVWRFSHDLLNDCLKARQERAPRRQVDLESVVKAASTLVREQGGQSLPAFFEALSLWTALSCGQNKGLPSLVRAIDAATGTLRAAGLEEEDANELVARICDAACWPNSILSPPERVPDASVHRALVEMAGIVARWVEPRMTYDICSLQIDVINLGHTIVQTGQKSGQMPAHPVWEVLQAQVPALRSIGQACTQGVEHDSLEQGSIYSRLVYAQLLMWAGLWLEAGAFVHSAITRIVQAPPALNAEEEIIRALSSADLAVCALLEAGDRDGAWEIYTSVAEQARSQRAMKPLSDLYELSASIVLDWEGTACSWTQMVDERHKRLLESLDGGALVVIGPHACSGISSLAVQGAHDRGLPSLILPIEGLKSFQALPPNAKILFLGGHRLTMGPSQWMRPFLTPDEYARVATAELQPPTFGVAPFQVGARKGVWISAWHLLDAMRHWLDIGGLAKLLGVDPDAAGA